MVRTRRHARGEGCAFGGADRQRVIRRRLALSAKRHTAYCRSGVGDTERRGVLSAGDVARTDRAGAGGRGGVVAAQCAADVRRGGVGVRSEEHTSELQSLMRISYAVFCLKKKKK